MTPVPGLPFLARRPDGVVVGNTKSAVLNVLLMILAFPLTVGYKISGRH